MIETLGNDSYKKKKIKAGEKPFLTCITDNVLCFLMFFNSNTRPCNEMFLYNIMLIVFIISSL